MAFLMPQNFLWRFGLVIWSKLLGHPVRLFVEQVFILPWWIRWGTARTRAEPCITWFASLFFFFREVNVSIPQSTRKNGTLYLHAFLYPKGKSHTSRSVLAHSSVLITTYAFPQAVFVNLLRDEADNKVQYLLAS